MYLKTLTPERQVWGLRYYIPTLGRWTSRDPSKTRRSEGNIGFVQNDPVNALDAIGLTILRLPAPMRLRIPRDPGIRPFPRLPRPRRPRLPWPRWPPRWGFCIDREFCLPGYSTIEILESPSWGLWTCDYAQDGMVTIYCSCQRVKSGFLVERINRHQTCYRIRICRDRCGKWDFDKTKYKLITSRIRRTPIHQTQEWPQLVDKPRFDPPLTVAEMEALCDEQADAMNEGGFEPPL